MEEGFTMVKTKRTRDQSPKTVSPLRKHPRPNGNPDSNQVSIRFKITIVKTEGWTSAFEIALSLFKAYPPPGTRPKHKKGGAYHPLDFYREDTGLRSVYSKTDGQDGKVRTARGRNPRKEVCDCRRTIRSGARLLYRTPPYYQSADDPSNPQSMDQDSTASQSHASSDHAHRQSPVDQERLTGLQPGNRLPGTHIGDTGNNSREYTTTIHSPHQPPRDKYGQCCGGHHGTYELHLVTYEQSDRAHKNSPGRPKEKRGCCSKRRTTEHNRGDPTSDCTGKTPQASILKWNTRRADWVKYSQTLQTLTPDIPPNIDIYIHLDNILEAVQSAADISVPRHTQAKHNRRTNHIPPEGKIYTRQLSITTKAFKRPKTDESRQELRAIQKIAKCELHKLKTKAWDDCLALVSEGDDCIITATPSTRRRFDLPPLSLVSDQDLMDAELTNPDRALVPDL
ncbi:hypothetical protein LSH36_368g05016 [Paralvinella palmiformis]|uniref:Uncharacterized protein n=1 Tax=Paralvinella palmiformis TaxID=53620 RepID=A0AAD9JDT5_9ANNE|nr:hypothetical protein LSH36_368g05016 [Paralvinella palmiformis]